MSVELEQQQADELLLHAVDTIRERMTNEDFTKRLVALETAYRAMRTNEVSKNEMLLIQALAETPTIWPMRLYLADLYLQSGDYQAFETEVQICLASATDSFVVLALFTFMTRLFVLRCQNPSDSVQFVKATLDRNPSTAPYIRTIYIQILLEEGDFEEAYEQLKNALAESNPMLTIEALEILPLLLARLGRLEDVDMMVSSMSRFANESITKTERNDLVASLLFDVQEREQLGDLETSQLLLRIANAIHYQ